MFTKNTLKWVSLLLLLAGLPAFQPVVVVTATATNEVDMGTTLVAIKFDGGVIVAADSRTSSSGYVSNRFAKKLNVIDDGCVLCRSGSAADTAWLVQQTKQQMESRKYKYNTNRSRKVSEVANCLKYLFRKRADLQASMICAGCEDNGADGKGRIYTITRGGTLIEEDFFSVSGSGSTVLLGHLDSLPQLKGSKQLLSEEAAIALTTKLLKMSIARDGSSGGLIRIMVLSSTKKDDPIKELTVYPENLLNNKKLSGFVDSV